MMDNSTQKQTDATGESQREALKDSMEKATRQQPGEFKDELNESKRVEIGGDVTDAPIKGIDP